MIDFKGKRINDNLAPVYTLSVASTLTGINKASILQYISKGLIIPFKKESGRNLFSDVDVLRLKYIRFQLEEQGLNIAGIKAMLALIPCWAIRNCSQEDRIKCAAYSSSSQPCWDASEKGPGCKNIDCRQCSVYLSLQESNDLKGVIRKLIN
jgi:MerR family transcriptional regulator/heat shock protein HspR